MDYQATEVISEIRFKKIRLWKNQIIIQTVDTGNIVIRPEQILIFQTRRSVFLLSEKPARRQTKMKTKDIREETQNV